MRKFLIIIFIINVIGAIFMHDMHSFLGWAMALMYAIEDKP